ncbi:RNase A-like domain-containing protein [Streptomyces sp. NPDC049040]|uniref:RNase A-like domain-containing protein n=1 Tax=Streptomyces sp. NPDC049040 TaxID=3365593 RepID=UPI00371CB06F
MGGDGLPDARERADQLKRLETASPTGSGGFDVRPANLYYTSYRIRDEQFAFDTVARNLVHALADHRQVAGNGEGPGAFADAYRKVAKRFLEVWAKSVASIGGAAVGFTVTANNYAAADWFVVHKQSGPPPMRQPPVVIETPPDYGEVPDIRWRGTNADSDWGIVRALGHIPDFVADHVEKVIDEGLRLGGLYEITPGMTDGLGAVGDQWKVCGAAVVKTGENLTGEIGYITDDKNDEWQKAMRSFCQTIWGTTAWGKTRGEPSQPWKTSTSSTLRVQRRPIITVLDDTALAIEKACQDALAAQKTLRDIVVPAAVEAAKLMIQDTAKSFENPLRDIFDTVSGGAALVAQMVASFRSHMPYDRIHTAVDTFQQACHALATELSGRMTSLDEAYLSAPTFQAEEARSEGFGARSLNDFKHQHKWTVQGDPASGHTYPLDLANQEYMGGAHGIDKHVGKTDEQLAQRLRDQGGIPGASSYKDLSDAQKYTQRCLDMRSEEIKDFLDSPPPPDTKTLNADFGSDGPVTGRSISKDDYASDPQHPRVSELHGVQVVIKRDPGLDPPFIVTTSTPD